MSEKTDDRPSCIGPGEVLDELAQRLYWKLSQLDPIGADETSWRELPQRDRELYRLVIEDLCRFSGHWQLLHVLCMNGPGRV